MNAIMERYVPMVAFLGETLPGPFEILLMDVTEKGMPVVAQYRARPGAAEPLRRYLKTVLKSRTVVANGMLTNRSDVMRRERMDKTSILLIKDDEGVPVGALAISADLTGAIPLYATVQSLLTFNNEEIGDIRPRQDMGVSPQQPTLEIIDRMLGEFTDRPERMTAGEKTEFLLDLYDTGVFRLKGAVAKAALALSMSQQSIYRYLSKIRTIRGE